MSTDGGVPIDVQTAYRQVQAHLDDSDPNPSKYDSRLTASVCLRSSTPEHQSAGATLAAKLADQSGIKIESLLYDLPAALDATQPKTRVHAIAAVEQIAHLRPTVAVDVVDCIIPRLSDSNPLVREAACSALAAILNGYMCKSESEILPEQTGEQFRSAIDPLFTQIRDEQGDQNFEWTAPFAVNFPQDTFWGRVETDESRRPYIRWQATYAIGLLAHWFSDYIAERSQYLATLPFEADKPETRGYAVDALGRADTTEALQEIRNRACQLLAHETTREDGLAVLRSFTMESPHHLVDVASAVSTELETLTGRQRRHATKIVMHAAVFNPGEITGSVRDIVKVWLSEDDEVPPHTSSYSAGLLASVAANHPDLVLPFVTRAAGLYSTATDSTQMTASEDARTIHWDTERAWNTLVEAGKKAPETVWTAIDREALRSKLAADTTDSQQANQLYAHIVPVSPPEETLECLFKQLRSEIPGASSALRTLATRDPITVAQTASALLEESNAPPRQMLRFLEHLSSEAPEELEPLQTTLWSWNDTIQPTDERWPTLVTIIGRTAVALDDRETISEMLHLEDPTYCQQFLETKCAEELIQSAPNQAIPPLVEHLTYRGPELRRKIVRMFATTHGDYSGWSSTIRETLSERLDDPDWRVRVYAVRALRVRFDSTVRTAIKELIPTETNPDVRFEAHRVLRQAEGS